MGAVQNIDRWATRHHPAWLDFIRMALGVYIFIKGVLFIQNTAALEQMLASSNLEWGTFALAHYVALAHLVGGPLIAMGLITRTAIIFQIPILLGAVIFINSERGLYSVGGEFWTSLIVLLLLILFLVLGSGPISIDNYWKKRQHEGKEY